MSRTRRFTPHVNVKHTNYFRLTAEEDGTVFTMKIGANVSTDLLSYIEYSIDEGESWTTTYNQDNTTVTITIPSIDTNQSVIMRGSGRSLGYYYESNRDYTQIYSNDKKFSVSGLIMTLLRGALADRDTRLDETTEYSFKALLSSTKVTHAHQLIMPPNVTKDCFNQMFHNCKELVSSPLLQAQTLVHGCYKRMFSGCTQLNYVKMMALELTDLTPVSDNATYQWLTSVSSNGTFDKNRYATWTTRGANGVPTNWTINLVDP